MASSNKPPAKRLKLSMASFTHQLTIKVITKEDNKQDFLVPEGLICAYSDFIKNACGSGTAKSNVVVLEDTSRTIFSLFLTWVLTGNIENASEYLSTTDINHDAVNPVSLRFKKQQEFLQIIECFLLGEILQAEDFRNSMIDLLVVKTKEYFDNCHQSLGHYSYVIERVWIETTSESPLRCLIIESWAPALITLHEPLGDAKLLCSFFIELSRYTIGLLHTGGKLQAPWEKDPCRYHTHAGQPEGYSCAKSSKAIKESKESEEKLGRSASKSTAGSSHQGRGRGRS